MNLSDGGTTEPRRLRSVPFLLSLYLPISRETLRGWQSHRMEGDDVSGFLHGRTFTLNHDRTENKLYNINPLNSGLYWLKVADITLHKDCKKS